LIGLLLPAVQKIREAAARMSCSNNLKQLALAMHNHHDATGAFPSGGNGGCCFGTWQVNILPYLEQANLFQLYRNLGGTDATGPRYGGGTNLQVTRSRLTILTCPSDTPNAPLNGITSHNYAVNYGNMGMIYGLPFASPWPFNPVPGTLNGYTFGGAPFGSTVPVRLTEITDGTSNTLLAAEVIQGQRNDLRGFSWWAEGAGFVTAIGPNSSSPDVLQDVSYCVNQPPNPPCTAPYSLTNPMVHGARSRHSGGVNAAFCDGSVRFIPNSIRFDVWQAMSTSRGGEVYSE